MDNLKIWQNKQAPPLASKIVGQLKVEGGPGIDYLDWATE